MADDKPEVDEELVFHPEQEVLGEGEGLDRLFCFLEQDRVCGPACMAFLTHPRSSDSSELATSQEHCALLLAADRIGRNITILASTLAQSERRRKMADIDAKREAGTPKPEGPFAQPTSPFPKRSP